MHYQHGEICPLKQTTLSRKNDRYHFAAVSSLDEAGKLIENGYEYVTEMEGMRLFRKPK
jgi:hypothetical protein